MEITASDKRSQNKTELSSGIASYIEEQTLSGDISQIMEEKNPFKQLKKLKKLNMSYKTDLSHSHIGYHIKHIKRKLIRRLCSFLCIVIIVFYFLFALFSLYKFYMRYFHLDSSESTLQNAIEYYNAEDYTSAQIRYEVLLENGWDNYIIFRDLNYIYQSQNNYDKAANLLLDYLTTYYGWANISPENDALKILASLSYHDELSASTLDRIRSITDSVSNYNALYLQIFEHIQNKEYSEAMYLCQSLKTIGADGFYYASCYSNILINTGKTTEAYEYILKLVRNDITAHARMISPQQRRALVNYIIPYLNDEQVFDCENYLYNELEHLKIPSDTLYAEPYIPYANAANAFEAEFSKINYFNSIDSIYVSEHTTMINAKECYYIRTTHIDAATETNQYFFMDMNRNIYMFLDGKYILLPKDQPSDFGGYDPPFDLHLKNSKSPELELTIEKNTADTGICSIINTSTGEIYLENISVSYSEYHAFAYGEENEVKFTLIFSQNDIILLIKEDFPQKYSVLEGRYPLSEN